MQTLSQNSQPSKCFADYFHISRLSTDDCVQPALSVFQINISASGWFKPAFSTLQFLISTGSCVKPTFFFPTAVLIVYCLKPNAGKAFHLSGLRQTAQDRPKHTLCRQTAQDRPKHTLCTSKQQVPTDNVGGPHHVHLVSFPTAIQQWQHLTCEWPRDIALYNTRILTVWAATGQNRLLLYKKLGQPCKKIN